jgi:uncharacterized protein
LAHRYQTDLAAWQTLLDSKLELFKIILLYGTKACGDTLEETSLTSKQKKVTADPRADSARLIHAYWLDHPLQGLALDDLPGIMSSRQPVRAPVKVGRN